MVNWDTLRGLTQEERDRALNRILAEDPRYRLLVTPSYKDETRQSPAKLPKIDFLDMLG